ncbi:alpha/beta hydrolase [Deinococcus aquiradiocola]|uniref:Lipase n=1 Tax=Deinococcus aquiradiocola TaxID=393059 RepID=A0A917PPZ7_9DEIO|nr:alpha/beta hydrolase [Deinococcus aquiradiocola]GGJ87487.1 lipase [Deinococcus aquiradiocola]
MPLEPELHAHLLRLAAQPGPPPGDLDAYRAAATRSAGILPRRDLPLSARRDLHVPTPDGPLPARLYVPPAGGVTGLLLYFHGGGWVASDVETHDALCADLASVSGVRVLSVAYRLAPETPFPGPLDDCWHATRWAAGHAAELGADAARLAVGGDSAGGNLAAGVALRARDAGGPALAAQLLIYPATDLSGTDTPSYRDNARGYGLTTAAMRTFIGMYVARPGDALHPYASPLLAPDLSGLPPTLILTAEFDPLRDDGERFARALEGAGVQVTHRPGPGLIHTFARLAALSPGSAAAVDDAALWLGERLA